VILVEIGHEAGLDLLEQDGKSVYVPINGQRTTTIRIPEGVDLADAFTSIKALLVNHMQEGHRPVWIKASDDSLQQMLINHYGLNGRTNRRPASWGQEGN
jgi:predicted outer membrane lipoprotein